MKVLVASRNPVKIRAAEMGFRLMFPHTPCEVVGIHAESGVSDQPMTESETRLGALNRAAFLQARHPEADFFIGIEGGIEDGPDEMRAFAVVVVLHASGKGEARSATFALPHPVAELVRQGIELGVADDQVFGKSGSKQQNGAIGLLTGDAITREALYAPAVAMAFVPFKWPDWYLPTP